MLPGNVVEKQKARETIMSRRVKVLKTPKGLNFRGSEQRPAYCHNTVARIPKAGSKTKDEALKLAFGREVTRRIIGNEYSKDTLGCADPKRLTEVRRALGVE